MVAILRKVARARRDPILDRRKARNLDAELPPPLKQPAIAARAAQKHGWAERTANAFLASLEMHAFPKLGPKRVETITADDVDDVFIIICLEKPTTVKKVRQRIAVVRDYSSAKG